MPTSPATQFILASGQIITPDTCTAMQHSGQAEATMHPVDDGSSIADHVIRRPQQLSLTTVWTPRPPDGDYLPAGVHRGQDAFDILIEALQRRQPIRIEMDGLTYDPMVLTSIQMPRAFDDGDSRTINVEAVQIQIVSGQTVKVAVAPPLKRKGKRKRTNAVPRPAGVKSGQINAASNKFLDWCLDAQGIDNLWND
jgi:hypothetical protein